MVFVMVFGLLVFVLLLLCRAWGAQW